MLKPDTLLQGRFVIEKVLGQGGQGVVYLARHVKLANKPVAVKELVFQISDAQRRAAATQAFRKEAELLATLDHPNLVDVTDYFEEGEHKYLVMTYVDGSTLEELLDQKGGPLDVSQVLEWMDQICDVLQYLHHRSPPVIYRDLKPSNIKIDSKGRVRLLDFGIARSVDAQGKTNTFVRGSGTPGFAPLEQLGAAGTADPRSDVYSMGATIYNLVTGAVPPTAIDLMLGQAALEPPTGLNVAVPRPLEAAVLRMMSLRVDDRQESILRVRSELRAVLSGRPFHDLAAPSSGSTAWPPAKERLAAWGGGAVAAAVLAWTFLGSSLGPGLRLLAVVGAVSAVVAAGLWGWWSRIRGQAAGELISPADSWMSAAGESGELRKLSPECGDVRKALPELAESDASEIRGHHTNWGMRVEAEFETEASLVRMAEQAGVGRPCDTTRSRSDARTAADLVSRGMAVTGIRHERDGHTTIVTADSEFSVQYATRDIPSTLRLAEARSSGGGRVVLDVGALSPKLVARLEHGSKQRGLVDRVVLHCPYSKEVSELAAWHDVTHEEAASLQRTLARAGAGAVAVAVGEQKMASLPGAATRPAHFPAHLVRGADGRFYAAVLENGHLPDVPGAVKKLHTVAEYLVSRNLAVGGFELHCRAGSRLGDYRVSPTGYLTENAFNLMPGGVPIRVVGRELPMVADVVSHPQATLPQPGEPSGCRAPANEPVAFGPADN